MEKEYRKIATIRIVEKTEKGYLVQNSHQEDEHVDQWFIDNEYFEKNYEEVK